MSEKLLSFRMNEERGAAIVDDSSSAAIPIVVDGAPTAEAFPKLFPLRMVGGDSSLLLWLLLLWLLWFAGVRRW
jgi:hypothetical protein